MCCDLSFCVGDNVLISDACSTPADCENTALHNALAISIGMTLSSPVPKVACVLDVAENASTVKRHTFYCSTNPFHRRRDRAVVLVSACGRSFRLCQKVLDAASKNQDTSSTVPQIINPTLSPMPRHMRVVHVIRLLLENKFRSSVGTGVGSKKENRRIGRRSCFYVKAKFTLAEWEDLVLYVKHICNGVVISTPNTSSIANQMDAQRLLRFEEKEMTVETVDFLSLMRTLGLFDVNRFLKYIAVARKARRAATVKIPTQLRIIGDYICEEPGKPQPGRATVTSNRECIISLGSTLSAVTTPSVLPEKHRCIVLRRPSCEYDTRDRSYVSPLEMACLPSSALLEKCSDETREKNRVYFNGDNKRTEQKRLFGYRWSRISRVDPRTLFFDTVDADEILGEIFLCIPTLTFFGGATAMEIKTLCDESNLLEMFTTNATHSRTQTQ